jgi:hypothetical protein
MVCCRTATAQTPGVLYTWNGTGNIQDWIRDTSKPNYTTLTNTTAGQLTITEIGDEGEPGSTDPEFYGRAQTFADGFNRMRESGATSGGGLDLTGLDYIEIDVSHNGAGPVNVEFYMQTTPGYSWIQAGSDGTISRTFQAPDWSLGPGTHTLRFPVNLLTKEEQAWITGYGLSVRDHVALGYLTWTVSEVRSVGTPLSVRDLATHNVGTSDNGLNGAFVNFDNAAVVGHITGQPQSGLSHNASGPGSLRWTDKGTQGVSGAPSGAAITWGNGTSHANDNSYYQRPTDLSNYNAVTFRMSATDALNGGGMLGVQPFFQTVTGGSYSHHGASGGIIGQFGEVLLPIDGQFHDLVIPLSLFQGNPDFQNTQVFGFNLFSHTNDLTINVDLVRFSEEVPLEGDYNGDGKVDAADYVVWRKAGTPGGYELWSQNFGNPMTGGGGGAGGQSAVPEPSAALLLLPVALGLIRRVGREV